MKNTLLASAILLASSVLANSAQAQSVFTATVNNNTPVSVTFSSPSGCLGSNSFSTIGSGGSQTSNITSPYSTSNGCSIRYTRSDNGRYCSWNATRTRSSSTASWNYPTINTSSSGSGVTCSANITSVSSNGNWSASFTIAP
ncbi:MULTISPECIES: hypothetical protein [Methylobacterium]|jgi:hypothetical protein|uniref:hypothetical protein n=1 Tax=Methylobacterium TaxID=407 RepID=UPI000B873CA2|nr:MULTISPECIES: hypothetical protein [Methylobacterium]MBK3400603.1 hypothetical protein [Methylobacterium ajmalii]MBK3408879.1 hypothetical protein [Methylobacterium ajmalii]MBK3422323.1 hypothetical protein [Methylobacterium ajmalii]MBZ6414977.1 hypothetical protein [Methylobacterium sp.]